MRIQIILHNLIPRNIALTPLLATVISLKDLGLISHGTGRAHLTGMELSMEMMPGRINAYSLVDLQFNKKLPKLHTTIKLGSSNLFNNKVYQAYGSPAVGAIYYVALTFDDLLK